MRRVVRLMRRDVERRLERRQRAHDGRQRRAQRFRGGGETAAIDDADEGRHRPQLVHLGDITPFFAVINCLIDHLFPARQESSLARRPTTREHAMSHRFADIAFTPNVQRHAGAPRLARAVRAPAGTQRSQRCARDRTKQHFWRDADGFYPRRRSAKPAGRTSSIAAARPGSSRCSRRRRLGFADFRGNVQHVSTGNALGDDRASIIVMDYANRRRLKLLGHLRFVDAGGRRSGPGPAGGASRLPRPRRARRALSTWPPSTGTARSTSRRGSRKRRVAAATQPLRDRIAELEARLAGDAA